ncbi:unnamed protein product [Arctia plantaginis]|uniref:MYND-type domain-containing protein n=1 Tax=Arctia plantaginis TaxID=874455 RepID=A0A8S1BNQ0_ARCPL|nr:unnamed protein product [Arctia plantaginis]
MENVNILSQMKQYDFNSPINVTMMFEECEDEALFQNVLREIKENDAIKQDKTEKPTSNTKVQTSIENLHKNYTRAKQVSLQNMDNKLPENSSPFHEVSYTSKTLKVNQSILIQKNCSSKTTENMKNSMYEKCQSDNNKETTDRNIKTLLDIVSENLILVMRLYYNYYYDNCKKDPPTAANLSKQFDKCKAHFFDLSYSTVVSLILPEENNKKFVENFLNKTVADASKVLQGKCERKHVEPFYNEMIEWVKKKREYIKTFGLQFASKEKNCEKRKNENKTLKALLADSPPAFSQPNTTNISEQLEISASLTAPILVSDINGRDMTPENGICIFSAGDREREKSININPNLLQNQGNYHGLKDTQLNIKSNSTNSLLNPRQTHYNQRVNQVQRNDYHQMNTFCHNTVRTQPQPYNPNHHHYTTSNVSVPNFQNISPGTHNYQTQLNSNSFTSSVCNNAESGQMYYRQCDENLATPIITNVTSLNPHSRKTYSAIGRCCVCGKNTNTRCQKCNDHLYCSTLCQELGVSNHKRKCKK